MEAISMYPNPARAKINIKNPYKKVINKIIITDLTGMKIREQNDNTNVINVSQLKQGIYLVQILSNKNMSLNKIIKN
ncbi:MAG: T9SS type A sorting domain-containing protein [Bdellovibrionota bacterium]